VTAARTKAKPKTIVRTLEHDTEKVLKRGKRRYGKFDDNGYLQNAEYLTAEEVEQLGSPDSIKVTIEAA
jgi:hypothetical protein